jgi:hypothetical protein
LFCSKKQIPRHVRNGRTKANPLLFHLPGPSLPTFATLALDLRLHAKRHPGRPQPRLAFCYGNSLLTGIGG